jgi:hypothetical protein
MKIHKTTLKLKGKFKCAYYTKSFPAQKKLIMDAWYRYTDGFEKTEEEFEEFKERIQCKIKLITVEE